MELDAISLMKPHSKRLFIVTYHVIWNQKLYPSLAFFNINQNLSQYWFIAGVTHIIRSWLNHKQHGKYLRLLEQDKLVLNYLAEWE